MSKLERLIQQYCPDGVEYYKVKDIYKRIKGTPITAGKMKEIANSSGSVRIFAGGKTAIDANEEDIPNATITKVPAVLVQSRGVIDVIYYDKPFTFKNELWGYTTDNKIAVKYLYYVLKNNVQVFRDAASGMGALPQISLKVTEDFEIPVPPLPVQEEIVRILDTFTELQAELQAELQKRLQQYNHYRDNLLSFEGRDDIVYKKLGEVCEFRNGFAFKSNLFKNDGCPIIRITNISGHGVNMEDVKYFHMEDYPKIKMSLFEVSNGDILVAMSGATTGKIGTYKEEDTAYLNQRIGKFIPKQRLDNRFLYHFLLTQVNEMYRISGGGAQPNLSSNDLKSKILIPLPSLEEQKRIASILDRFDTLTNDLTSGLPAEMEKRRQQYEYYRDRLLTFKRL